MKAILEFEAPGNCLECPCGHVVRDGRVACGALENKFTDREIGRALYCPLRIMEDDE